MVVKNTHMCSKLQLSEVRNLKCCIATRQILHLGSTPHLGSALHLGSTPHLGSALHLGSTPHLGSALHLGSTLHLGSVLQYLIDRQFGPQQSCLQLQGQALNNFGATCNK